MKRRVLPLLLALGMIMWTGGAFALTHPGAYTVADNTMVEKDRTFSSRTYGWADYIGGFTDFNFHGIDVTFSNGKLTFDMFTNFNDDGTYDDGTVYVYLADFGIDVDPDIPGYEYGVNLIDHDLWTEGIAPTLEDLDPGLYSVTDWNTSYYFLENAAPNYLYGRSWDQGNPRDCNVAIAGYTDKKDATISFSELGGTGAVGDPKYKWSVTINAGDIGFSSGESMNIFWGGATCANDAIGGTLMVEDAAPITTPEPATLVLTGFGLIGLVAIGINKSRRRRRRKQYS